MKIKNRSMYQWFSLVVSVLTIVVAGCTDSTSEGTPGAPGATGPSGDTTVIVTPPGGVASPSGATALTIGITGATISSPPVVNFTITNQDGVPVAGFPSTALRFNIAKLIPSTIAAPSHWQNYIVTGSSSGMRGSQERNRTGSKWGTLVDNLNGTYTYTFKTDITSAAANPCPAPCTDANGNALDISYQPSLTHRVTIQQGDSAYPKYNATYDFVPAGGAVTVMRDIVTTAQCNECHNQLSIHGSRTEIKLCVTCHNPGTWSAGTPNQTADLKVMIHKIHRGHDLPSVVAGGKYEIGGHDYSDVHFPQDIRNCAKCHDGAVTAQGNNWQTQPSIAACGSCHDDIDFSKVRTGDDNGHPVEAVSAITDSAECLACHRSGEIAGSVAEKHTNPVKAMSAKFKFNIVDVSGGIMPVIKISVTDPTSSNAPYDIASGNATTNPIFKTSGRSRLALDIGWFAGAKDITNVASGADPWGIESPLENTDPGKPITINPVDACDGTPIADWTCTVDGNFVYTLAKLTPLPVGASGTGRVAFEGHPAGPDASGSYGPSPAGYNVPVKSEYKDFVITGTLAPRRQIVDIAKCNKCHDQLSLHGSNRTDEPQVCVICHNSNLTDVTYTGNFSATDPRFPGQRGRPKDATTKLPLASPLDGKLEESADFKFLIHGVHAAAKTNYPIGTTPGTPAHGFRVKGIQVRANDYSHIRFPGILKDCLTCHLPGTYELKGAWENPTASGFLSTTVRSTPLAIDLTSYRLALADQTDDYRLSPTVTACSSCHDSDVAKAHMKLPGGGVFEDDARNQASITTSVVETCSVCHGPGRDADVKVKHGVK